MLMLRATGLGGRREGGGNVIYLEYKEKRITNIGGCEFGNGIIHQETGTSRIFSPWVGERSSHLSLQKRVNNDYASKFRRGIIGEDLELELPGRP